MSSDTPSTVSRRRFLLGSLAAGSGLASLGGLSPLMQLARAGIGSPEAADRYFVFCYFSGGWDVLLSLDPRDPADFHGGNVKKTLIDPGYGLIEDYDTTLLTTPQGHTLGPFMGDLFGHMDKLAIVRGMSMETLTHEVGRRRFLTGKPPSGLIARGSSAATWLASQLGSNDPIPNLAMGVESYNADQPNFASALKVSTVSDLIRALRASDPALLPIERQQIGELLARTAQCPHALASPFWQNAEDSRGRAQDMVAQKLDTLFDFMADTPEMEALRTHYQITSANQAQSSSLAQAALASQAIKGGVSRVVSIQVARGLDTHYDEWADDQGPTQMGGFNAVARLIEDLSEADYGTTGTKWIDHTTIIGFSEFCRGSMINANNGRDHSLTNACFLAGAGIQGGQVIGRSSDIGMTPTPTNLATGVWDPDGGTIIKPEHIIQALLYDVGVYTSPDDDPADLRVAPLKALLENP